MSGKSGFIKKEEEEHHTNFLIAASEYINSISSDVLKSHLNILCSERIRIKNLSTPKRTSKNEYCQYCHTPWKNGDFSVKILPEKRNGKRMKKLLKKINTFKPLGKIEKKKIKAKHFGNTILLNCLICTHRTTFKIGKKTVKFTLIGMGSQSSVMPFGRNYKEKIKEVGLYKNEILDSLNDSGTGKACKENSEQIKPLPNNEVLGNSENEDEIEVIHESQPSKNLSDGTVGIGHQKGGKNKKKKKKKKKKKSNPFSSGNINNNSFCNGNLLPYNNNNNFCIGNPLPVNYNYNNNNFCNANQMSVTPMGLVNTSYCRPYNTASNTQYNMPYNAEYNMPYNAQCNVPYNAQYMPYNTSRNTPYNVAYNAQYNMQYNKPYNTQYNATYANNCGYNSLKSNPLNIAVTKSKKNKKKKKKNKKKESDVSSTPKVISEANTFINTSIHESQEEYTVTKKKKLSKWKKWVAEEEGTPKTSHSLKDFISKL